MPKFVMTQAEWRSGRAEIAVDGELHTFIHCEGKPPAWQDQQTGLEHEYTEFDIFD